MKNHNQFIRCLENIQDLSGQKLYDYAITYGGFFTRKYIKYDKKSKKYIIKENAHGVRDCMLTERQLKTTNLSNIYEAMQKRCLIAIID